MNAMSIDESTNYNSNLNHCNSTNYYNNNNNKTFTNNNKYNKRHIVNNNKNTNNLCEINNCCCCLPYNQNTNNNNNKCCRKIWRSNLHHIITNVQYHIENKINTRSDRIQHRFIVLNTVRIKNRRKNSFVSTSTHLSIAPSS